MTVIVDERRNSSNVDLQQRREDAVARGVATMLPVFADHATNSEITDVEGRRYIDLASGIAVLNTGHLHPKVKAAVAAQLDRLSHTCFQVMPYESYIALSERLNDLVPGDGPKKTLLLSSGAEAVENAIKIARAHTGRPGIISFSGAFHGRTMMGMALTGKVVPYKTGFGPFPGEIYHAPFPASYLGVSTEQAVAALETIFKADIEPSRVAAIIVEPVQGEGGFYVAPAAFLERVREICDQHGIVMIVDEIQTGFGRTGRMLAIEHSGVTPDLVTMAKSLAGGFPLSAVTGKAEIMDAPAPGGLGGTYAGSPLACAAALAVLEVLEEEQLCGRAVNVGRLITERFEAMSADPELAGVIGEIRGLGAMVAVEFVENGDAKRPDMELTKALVGACSKNGVVVLSCGVRGNVVRFLAPLTIEEEVLEEGLTVVERCLRDLVGARV